VTLAEGWGFKILSGGISFTGCAAQHNSADGFYVTGSAADSMFSSCLAEGNGYKNKAGECGGWLFDTARRSMLTGCVSKEPLTKAQAEEVEAAQGGFQAYGYKITGTASGVSVVGNGGWGEAGNTAWKGLILNTSSGAENLTSGPTIASNPIGGLAANIADRSLATSETVGSPQTSTTMALYRVPVAPGSIIKAVNLRSGSTAGTGMTHSWAALYTTAWQKLVVSADNVEAEWAVKTIRTFTLASPYTVPAGVTAIYVAICNVATVMPTMTGIAELVEWQKLAEPFMALNGSSSLSTPSTAPTETLHTASTGKVPYVWLT
jgi:hypothetical protein